MAKAEAAHRKKGSYSRPWHPTPRDWGVIACALTIGAQRNQDHVFHTSRISHSTARRNSACSFHRDTAAASTADEVRTTLLQDVLLHSLGTTVASSVCSFGWTTRPSNQTGTCYEASRRRLHQVATRTMILDKKH